MQRPCRRVSPTNGGPRRVDDEHDRSTALGLSCSVQKQIPAFDAAQQANADRLEQALRQIRDYEWEVKSGQVDADLGLDVLLTRL